LNDDNRTFSHEGRRFLLPSGTLNLHLAACGHLSDTGAGDVLKR
jgi:hypothetical protein